MPRPNLHSTLCLSLLLVTLLPGEALLAATPQVTNGGYMQVTPAGNDDPVPLPLKHTTVEAEIAATVASVTVTQQFQNPSSKPIEAVYVFPLPERAAVHAMTIQVGDRTVRGVVKKRKEARRAYEKAKAQGKTAALLDQERPNIFTQAVANIMPGDVITVTLRYVEDLLPEQSRYRFVFPMVVGPRYMGGGMPMPGKAGAGWAGNTARVPVAARISPPLLRQGKRPGHDISVKVRIDGGLPLRSIHVVTHKAKIEHQGRVATVKLADQEAIPNKDFVIRYALAGAAPGAAVLTQRDDHQGHVLFTLQPPASPRAAKIASREHVYVIDVSGSMMGRPLSRAKAVIRRCLASLTPQDTFQLIAFSGGAEPFAPRALPATKRNVQRALGWLSASRGGGGTEFIPALKLALTAPNDPARARAVVFLTDGYIGYEKEVLAYLYNHGAGSTVFSLGVGSAVNRYLIEGMARVGSGRAFVLLDDDPAEAIVQRLHTTLTTPTLTNISLDWGNLPIRDQVPKRLPDLFSDQPIVVASRYDGSGSGTITVRGLLAGKPFETQVPVTLPASPSGSPAIATLWARRQIEHWADALALSTTDPKELEQAITKTALAYNLVSPYTSMVAVLDQVRNPGGKAATVPVPVPLPQGVDETAAPPGAYTGTASGTAYGVGGLGVVGKGMGGGGGGGGTIGSSSLGTIGKSYGAGYGRGAGLLVRRARVPRIQMGKAVVMGSLDKGIIRRIIRRHLNQIRYCYQQALGTKPTLSGRVILAFIISAEGVVTHTQITASTLGNPAVEQCIAKAARRWRFPAVPGGGIVEVHYPFELKPAPPGKHR